MATCQIHLLSSAISSGANAFLKWATLFPIMGNVFQAKHSQVIGIKAEMKGRTESAEG